MVLILYIYKYIKSNSFWEKNEKYMTSVEKEYSCEVGMGCDRNVLTFFCSVWPQFSQVEYNKIEKTLEILGEGI